MSLSSGVKQLLCLNPDDLRAELLKIEDDFSAEKLRQEAENRRLRSRRRISGKEVPELQTQAVTEDAEEGERYAEKISE